MQPMNETKTRWGILGVAKIALDKIIPAIQAGRTGQVVAIASRSLDKAQAAAARFAIPRAYGSYEELLADPEVDAIYNPLPNHLHVPWSIRALEAGKHVLCEKAHRPRRRRGQPAHRRARAHGPAGARSGHGAHPPALAGCAGHRTQRPHRRAALDDGFLFLLQRLAHERAPPARHGRRRAARHRLLPHHHGALHLRGRARSRDRPARNRSPLRCGSPGLGHPGVSARPCHLHLLDPALAVPKSWTSWAPVAASASRSRGACPTSDRAVSSSMGIVARLSPGKRSRRCGFPPAISGAFSAIASARPSPRAIPRQCPSRTQWPTCA
jgi:hypothetical protein